MGNALVGVVHVEQGDARCVAGGAGFGDEGIAARHQRAISAAGAGVDDMVHHCKHARRIDNRTTRLRHRLQRRRAGAFVEEDAVDGDQCAAPAQIGHDMGVPDFVEQGLRFSQSVPPANANLWSPISPELPCVFRARRS